MSEGELILYTTEDGSVEISLMAQDGTVWLTQAEIATLFDTSPQAITQLVRSIYSDCELDEAATCKEFLQVRKEGSRQVKRALKIYNLDVILAIGYRVRSQRGIQFRRWANTVLNGAMTGMTAAEIIAGRSDVNAPIMGVTHWKGSVVRKGDTGTAKNYLKVEEVQELNRIVVMYLDYAEDQATKRKTVTMTDWADKLDTFLSFNERDLLSHAGKVRMAVAQELAAERYDEFDAKRRASDALAADEVDIVELERIAQTVKGREKGVGDG